MAVTGSILCDVLFPISHLVFSLFYWQPVPVHLKTCPLSPAQVSKLKSMQLQVGFLFGKGVDRDELKDTWGAARSQGRSHEGIDILAPRGTKVYSATEGLIADLRNNNLGGKVIWILGPAGTWHYYAHLDGHKRGLNVGDYVKKVI